jgi:hypothetical protein
MAQPTWPNRKGQEEHKVQTLDRAVKKALPLSTKAKQKLKKSNPGKLSPEQVRAKINKLDKEEKKINAQYDKDIQRISIKRAKIRKQLCPHKNTIRTRGYVVTICEDCGDELQ